MVVVVHDPRDRVDVEVVLVAQDAAHPHPGGHRVGADADPLALQVGGETDAVCITALHVGVVETAVEEDRGPGERNPGLQCHQVGGRREFAHVELEVADHPPVGADDRADLDGFDCVAVHRDVAAQQGLHVQVVPQCDRKRIHVQPFVFRRSEWVSRRGARR